VLYDASLRRERHVLLLPWFIPSCYFKPSMRLAVNEFGALATESPLRRRVTRDDLCSRRWRFPARSCMTLPVPVKRNRFFAPLCVFIFGIR
jgi:hypothetical protein